MRSIVCLLAALGGCAATAQSDESPQVATQIVTTTLLNGLPRVNDSFSGSLPIAGRAAPLPPGRWAVVRSEAATVKNVPLTETVVLARHDGPVLRSLIRILANLRPVPTGLPLSPTCTSSDVIWNDVRQAIPFGPQDCAAIVFERPALWRENPKMLGYRIIKQLDELGIQTPNILVTYALAETDGTWFLHEYVANNPDLAGISPDLSTQRSQSAWTAFNVAKDPQKQQYVDRMKGELAGLRDALRRALIPPPSYVPGSGLTPA